jgi:N-acetyl-alpha-D-glucosaminyl L-malate synthase BshA
LLGRDPAYRPAILHALNCSDAVTTVSAYLRSETERVVGFSGPMEVIHNFYVPRAPRRTPEEVRRELGLRDEVVLFHSSNLRPLKRIDLLLETIARIQTREPYKLLVLAGGSFAPFEEEVKRLNPGNRIIVREKVNDIEDYLQICDVGLFTSDSESFCLGILEAMFFGSPSVATRVGGIPEVIDDKVTGIIAPPGDAGALARAVEELIADPLLRSTQGNAALQSAQTRFSAGSIVPRYEALYRAALSGQRQA